MNMRKLLLIAMVPFMLVGALMLMAQTSSTTPVGIKSETGTVAQPVYIVRSDGRPSDANFPPSDGTAAKNGDYVLTDVRRIIVQKTSMVLRDGNVCGGLTWPADLVRIGLTKPDSNMPDLHWRIGGTVDGNFSTWAAGGVGSLPMRAAEANEIHVICDANEAYDLLIYRPRN